MTFRALEVLRFPARAYGVRWPYCNGQWELPSYSPFAEGVESQNAGSRALELRTLSSPQTAHAPLEPNTMSTRRSFQDRITKELTQWEPRIRVESVTVEPDLNSPQAAVATVTYKLVATQAIEQVSVNVSLGS